MTTLAVDKVRTIEAAPQAPKNDLPVIASDIIYAGALVGDNASGWMRPLVAADPFRGLCRRQADNSAGANGDINVEVLEEFDIEVSVVGATAVSDVGSLVYASDDDVFTLTSTSNTLVGRVKRWVSGTTCIVHCEADQVRSPA